MLMLKNVNANSSGRGGGEGGGGQGCYEFKITLSPPPSGLMEVGFFKWQQN